MDCAKNPAVLVWLVWREMWRCHTAFLPAEQAAVLSVVAVAREWGSV
jgi:hypothetical protein